MRARKGNKILGIYQRLIQVVIPSLQILKLEALGGGYSFMRRVCILSSTDFSFTLLEVREESRLEDVALDYIASYP